MLYESPYLAHFGILGQKWGIRRYQNEDGTLTEEGRARYDDSAKDLNKIKKDAAKDAKEYAMAKAYYGEGAGNRRKRIKNLTSEKMKNAEYKAEFERQLEMIDMEKTQKSADVQRKVNDTKNTVTKTARGVKNFLLGNAVPITLGALVVGTVIKNTGITKKIANWGRAKLWQIKFAMHK